MYPTGVELILSVIGTLPHGGRLRKHEAAFGWGWLIELLEDYGFELHADPSAAVQGDRLGAAEGEQGRCRLP